MLALRWYGLSVAIVCIGLLAGFYFNGHIWLWDNFQTPLVRFTIFGMSALFLYGFIVRAGTTAFYLYKNDKEMRNIEMRFNLLNIERKKEKVCELLRVYALKEGGTAIEKTLFQLALREQTRYQLSLRPLQVEEKIVFDNFDDLLYARVENLKQFDLGLFRVGLFGTVLGILLALFFGQNIPATVEETKEFLFQALSGMGIAYVSSVMGMGGALFLSLLNSAFEKAADETAESFRKLLFCTLSPILQANQLPNSKAGPS